MLNSRYLSNAGDADFKLGKQIIALAENMAMFAAERAATRDWKEHPMFGIAVDKDKWAIEYQNAKANLKCIVDTQIQIDTHSP